MSSWLLLFGLGVAWAAVLVPDFIRRNAVSRRSDTIGQFSRSLSTLERSLPAGRSNVVPFGRQVGRSAGPVVDLRDGAPLVSAQTPVLESGPQPRSRAQQRRVDIMTGLVAAALLSFVASVSIGGAATMINLVIDVLLVGYIGALLTVTRRERTRAQVGTLYSSNVRSFVQHETHLVTPAPVMAQRQRVAR